MTLSANAIQSAQALTTSDVWLLLMDISHDDLVSDLHLVNNTVAITHNSVEYVAYPFQVVLSNDDGEHLPKVNLTIDNVDRALVETIRSIADSPTIVIKLVLSDAPDDVELEITGLILREVEYDAFSITGTLYADDILNSRYPADRISLAAGYAGLFR